MHPIIRINNDEFLRGIFRENYLTTHVNSFAFDPNNIPNDMRGIAWAGGYYENTPLRPGENQFFCVSQFMIDFTTGRAVRRKANFLATYLIVADDVEEKLPLEQVQRLPKPSYILRTSNYSYQWGWILEVPETNMDRVNNLLDQLIANGLAPDGTDPGMKGVTRLIRTPDGFNTKVKRIEENGGAAPQCEVTQWNPELRYTMEQLAEPFNVELDAPRSDGRVDGAADVPDHPVLQHLAIKSTLSAGRYDITCPWVDTHTDKDDSGSAVFTNEDGTVGFQCHHGHCQEKTAGDVLNFLNVTVPGFSTVYSNWKMNRALDTLPDIPTAPPSMQVPILSFMGVAPVKEDDSGMDAAIVKLSHMVPGDEQRVFAETLLHTINGLSNEMLKITYNEDVRLSMDWTKSELTKIIKALHRSHAVAHGANDTMWLLDNIVLMTEGAGGFYNIHRNVFQSAFSLTATYGHMVLGDETPASVIANNPNKRTADRIGWHPTAEQTFDYDGRTYLNTYSPPRMIPIPGDVSQWLQLMDFLYKEHAHLLIQHMAFTLQRPDVKIRWQPLIGGIPRSGKTMSIKPLIKILAGSAAMVSNDDFEAGWGDVFSEKKAIAFEEVWQPDKRQFNRLKTKLANDDIETLNIKGQGLKTQRNLYSIYMFTNHLDALQFDDNEDKLLVIRCNERMSVEFYRELGNKIDFDANYIAHIYHYLLNVDLSTFDHGRLPVRTQAMYDMVKESRPEYETLALEWLEDEVFNPACFRMADMMSKLRDCTTVRSMKKVGQMLHREGYISHKAQRKGHPVVRFWSNDAACIDMKPVDLHTYYHKMLTASIP